MDLSEVSGTLPTHTTGGGPVLEQELSLSSTESGSTILLQLLEFKTHLLEAVEELHIRRDAETRFEDQVSKLVLEKQELEWEKESQQHQAETMANQHAESLISVKKEFQAKIRNIEEEKGKYQVSAELKDKEINNLKEELKSLQLLKYNLEKKSSELEQKLVLQSRSKDSHLNQLGEVEKRFSALARQCAVVKQAHEKLEQNVDEAMKINKKLTSANEKQETIIASLKKELEEVSNKLIKAKMSSVIHDKSHSPTGREQRIQQLQQKLNMETEMIKKLREENEAVRAEKQEVIRSLQHTQQLLLSQTQTLSRVEVELQSQREQYQALKQEHEVMREKSKATEDKVAQLMESHAASKTNWDKEREMFLDQIKSEQQDLQAVREAHSELHLRHAGLSSQAKVQAQHIYELEVQLQRKNSSHDLSVSTQLLPTVDEEIRGDKTLDEPISSSEPPCSGSLQHLASTQTKKPDCLEDTGAVTKLVATGATGGQDVPNHHQQSQFKQPLNPSNLFTSPLLSLCSLPETTGSDYSTLNKHINNWNTNDGDPNVASDLIRNASPMSTDSLQISKGSMNNISIPGYRSVDGSVDLLSKEKSDDGGLSEREEGRNDDVNDGEEQRNEEQQLNRARVQEEDVEEGGSAGEKRGTLMAQTTDRADRGEDSQRSTDDAGDTEQPETEAKDRVEGERVHTPETQIQAQTATDTTTEKSDTQPVIDLMDTEPPLAACEPSDCSQSVSQTGSENGADSNEGHETRREVFCSDEHQSVGHGSNSVMQHVCHDEAQTFGQDLLHQVLTKTTEEKPSDKSAASIPSELSEPLNQSSICGSQTNTAALAAQSDNIISIQELETAATQTQARNPADISSKMKQIDETCEPEREECMLLNPEVEQQAEQLRSPVTDDEDGECCANKKSKSQSSVDAHEDGACETIQGPLQKSNLKDACADFTVDTAVFDSEAGGSQEHMKNDKMEDAGNAKTTKTDVCPSHESSKPPAKQMLVEDTNESSLPSTKTHRSSFDWGSTQRKTISSRAKSDVSVLHQFVQGSCMAEQNTSDPGGLLGHPSSTIPMFLKSKRGEVPLVITRALDLLNASSVSGTAASSRRHLQGEWKAMGEMSRETATTDTESRAPLSISSFPFSTSSITVSTPSWQTTPGCSRAPASAAGPSSELDREPSFSQEREDQQSSFRAQISKIEQFLNAERLRLPKRRRTEN